MEESRLVEFINCLPDDSWEFSPDEAYKMWKEREDTVWQTREILIEKARNRKGRFQDPQFEIRYYPSHITNVLIDEQLAKTPWELSLVFNSPIYVDQSYRFDINHVLNRILNNLFELPKNEISMLNLSPLFLEQSEGILEFYIANNLDEDGESIYQISPEFEVCQLDCKLIFGVPSSHQQHYNLITVEVDNCWWDMLERQDDDKIIIPLFDFILVQRSKSNPADRQTGTFSLYFTIKDDHAAKKRITKIIPLDIGNSLKLGSYRNFTIELFPFYDRPRIECKFDFVNYCQSVIQHLEHPELQPRSFTVWHDMSSSHLRSLGLCSDPKASNLFNSNHNAWMLALAPG